MSTFPRSVVAVTAGLSLLGLAACSGGSEGQSGSEEQPPTSAAAGSGLAQFDPCGFFKPDELTSWGVSMTSEEFSPVDFEPGCQWEGENMGVTLQKNVTETVESYARSNWDKYEQRSLGGRNGAIAITAGGTGMGGCNALVDAGGGVVIYGVDGYKRDSVDACAEVEKIASQTASRLPE
ncbi:DUF3558 family protein [Saccharopolyspora hordei]